MTTLTYALGDSATIRVSEGYRTARRRLRRSIVAESPRA